MYSSYIVITSVCLTNCISHEAASLQLEPRIVVLAPSPSLIECRRQIYIRYSSGIQQRSESCVEKIAADQECDQKI